MEVDIEEEGLFNPKSPAPFRSTCKLSVLPSGEECYGYYGNKFLEFKISPIHNTLTVKGIIFDSIVAIRSDHYGKEDNTDFSVEAVRMFQDSPLCVVPGGREKLALVMDALLRTLIMSRTDDGKALPADFDLQSPGARRSDLFQDSFRRRNVCRKFFITTSGAFALGPRGTWKSDLVALIPGCHVPVVLRRINIRGLDTSEVAINCHYLVVGIACRS